MNTHAHRILLSTSTAALAAAVTLALAPASQATTVTFGPGLVQWQVPVTVVVMSVDAAGGSGGHDGAIGSPCIPGFGGEASAPEVPVVPGETIDMSIGGKGGDANRAAGGSGGLEGGGAGGTVASGGAGGGGGGGETALYDNSGTWSLQLGGGGGCGGYGSGDAGGGGNGGAPGASGNGDGSSGDQAGGGDRGGYTGGVGGTNSPVDGGGGQDGREFQGGAGSGSSAFVAGGGGGGGGFGGGGGGGAAAGGYGSGGGGGGGVVMTKDDGSFSWGVGSATSQGNGYVTLTYEPQPAPAVTIGVASGVGDAGATVTGTVNPEKLSTAYHVEYGTSAAYGQHTASTQAGSGGSPNPVSVQLSGLTPGTVYHYRLVATNASGTTDGSDETFRTTGTPVVATHAVNAVTPSGATLAGTVNPRGEATTYHFEYGTTTAYGQQSPDVAAGSDFSDHGVSASVSGLASGTLFHYRLVAVNASGTVHGADAMFTTASAGVPSGSGPGGSGPGGSGPGGSVPGGSTPPTGPGTSPTPRNSRTPVLSFLGKPFVDTGSVTWTLACTGAACRVAARLTTHVRVVTRVHGKSHGRTTTAMIGSASASIAAGHRDRLVVTLNAMGRRLSAKAGRLAASLAFSLASVGGTPHLVRTVRITFASAHRR